MTILSIGYLLDVYYAADASNNLISESSCAVKGAVIFTSGDEKVLLYEKEEIVIAKLRNGLYTTELNIRMIDEPQESVLMHGTLEEWHKRFAHVNSNKLKSMVENGAVKNFQISDPGSSNGFQCE